MSVYEMSKQQVADQLVRLVAGAPPSDEQNRALRTITHFEQRMWVPGAFEEAMRRAGPGRLDFSNDGRLSYECATAQPTELPEAVGRLVVEYSILVMPDEDPQAYYTTEEAAAYLGVSVATIKNYVHVTGRLQGEKRGHTLMFSRAELDEVEPQIKRGRGRRPQASQG